MLTDRIDGPLIAAAPRLQIVSNMAVGVDNIDLGACREAGVRVGHTPDVLTETTADTAFGLLLVAARRLVEGVEYVRSDLWGDWVPDLLWGRDVSNSTLGIVGPGRIGRAIARRGVGFGMSVVYSGRTRHEEFEKEVGARYVGLDELLAESDHVVLSAALTPQTRRLIGARELGLMKRTATLVNIARGGLVDTDALTEALRNGSSAAAGLDVTDPEPLRSDHPLVSLPNCVVIPHLGSSTARTRVAMAELAAENLVAGLRGNPLPAEVPPAWSS